MDESTKNNFREILLAELIPALGCTEPIAIALASARAREVLACPIDRIDRVDVHCSGNIVKNVKGVVVPNSGGLRGIAIASAMGITGGVADLGLEVLGQLTSAEVAKAAALVSSGKVHTILVPDEPNLYLRVELFAGSDHASVEIKYDHTRINRVIKNGEILLDAKINSIDHSVMDTSGLSIAGILAFADEVVLDDELLRVLDRQIAYNSAIAQEGITHPYGAEIGRTLLASGDPSDPRTRAKAYTAAGSDARMGGSALPVVINSGSGNQGMTVSIPVIEFAKALEVNEETLYRALIVSNLTAIHQKRFIGKLSAFCGVVSASAAAGAGIAYLRGFSYETIAMIITNVISTIGGMVCDGAKGSCASKIAMGLDNMLMAIHMAENGRTFQAGEGLVGVNVEETIQNIGRMARHGMRATDIEILQIMTE